MQRKLFVRLGLLCALMLTLGVSSCTKEKKPVPVPVTPPLQMEYFNLGDKEITADAPGFLLDVNHDGRRDLAFTTLLVGDGINQVDKVQFLISSNIKVNLPVNESEEIPVMSRGDLVVPGNFSGYQWFELSSILLVQKVISFTAPPVWEGHWKTAVHKYLPYQLVVDEKIYNGWVELSVDIPHEKIVLHKAAICKEANKTVKAGD